MTDPGHKEPMKAEVVNTDDLHAEYGALVEQLPWSAPIYLPTEKVPLPQRVEGMRRVVDIQYNRLSSIYREQFKALQAHFSGVKRCFIIGNGPSLNKTDLSQLAGEVVFAVNGFFLKMPELSWTPTFYVVEDHLVAEDRAAEINALRGPIKLFPTYLGYCLDEDDHTIFFNHRARKSYPHGFDFSTDASEITYTGCTVTYTCMQLAHSMGFEEIYLIGVDADYAIPADVVEKSDYGTGVLNMDSDDPNHFHPDYFGKGYRWHDPQVSQMIEAYKEAHRVTSESGRLIYNATVGGKLEVFPRRNFLDLFADRALGKNRDEGPASGAANGEAAQQAIQSIAEQAESKDTHLSRHPKLAVVDMTEIGGTTATGALKASLLEGWPRERLLEISSNGTHNIRIDGAFVPIEKPKPEFRDIATVAEILEAFDPDLILYRPLPEKPHLNELVMAYLEVQPTPYIIWIMDDWMARLEAQKPSEYAKWNADLTHLLQGATANFSISQAMSDALQARYNVEFTAFANGIEPRDWPTSIGLTQPETIVRYAGGLSEDMCLNSIVDLAKAIEQLNRKFPVRLEIQTREHWAKKHAAIFNRFKATTLYTDELSETAYRVWLSHASIVVLAYNFDEDSQRYIRLSMANKLPELLISGRPVLAIGPRGQAGLDYLEQHDLAARVLTIGHKPIMEEILRIRDLQVDADAMATRARRHAMEHFDLRRKREAFQDALREVGQQRTLPQIQPEPAYVAKLMALSVNSAPNGSAAAASAVAKVKQVASASSPAKPATPKAKPKPAASTALTVRTTPYVQRSRFSRIMKFYFSWRGLLATLGVSFFLIPSIYFYLAGNVITATLIMAPAIGTMLIFAMFGYLYTLILDHSAEVARRVERLERTRRS